MNSESGLELVEVSVDFGEVTAVNAVSLQLGSGRVLALLGPSGCGKSTLLRAIAGLQPLARGQVVWRGQDISATPVHRRRFGLMFQDHALFPHRNVAENVAFGLRMAGVARVQRSRRVDELLELVGLGGLGHRTIGTLSGGQAQRVALARALAPEPELLLLDEPLGSLDRALRDHLANEIRTIVKDLSITAVHVTHDHDEAMTAADDVALMEHGSINRFGPISQLLADPGDGATAEALGLETVWRVPTDSQGRAQTPIGVIPGPANTKTLVLLIRPELVHSSDTGADAEATASRYRAGAWLTTYTLHNGQRLVGAGPERVDPGERVRLSVDVDQITVLDGL